MGTHTVGIMYGAAIPRGADLFGDDNGSGLVEFYEQATRPAGESWEWSRRELPRHDEDYRVIGFLVALAQGNSRAYGACEMDTVRLDALAETEPYAASIANARRRWDAFAAWAMAKQCVTFDVPRLWLVATEVA